MNTQETTTGSEVLAKLSYFFDHTAEAQYTQHKCSLLGFVRIALKLDKGDTTAAWGVYSACMAGQDLLQISEEASSLLTFIKQIIELDISYQSKANTISELKKELHHKANSVEVQENRKLPDDVVSEIFRISTPKSKALINSTYYTDSGILVSEPGIAQSIRVWLTTGIAVFETVEALRKLSDSPEGVEGLTNAFGSRNSAFVYTVEDYLHAITTLEQLDIVAGMPSMILVLKKTLFSTSKTATCVVEGSSIICNRINENVYQGYYSHEYLDALPVYLVKLQEA